MEMVVGLVCWGCAGVVGGVLEQWWCAGVLGVYWCAGGVLWCWGCAGVLGGVCWGAGIPPTHTNLERLSPMLYPCCSRVDRALGCGARLQSQSAPDHSPGAIRQGCRGVGLSWLDVGIQVK